MSESVADDLIQSGYRRWLLIEEAKAEAAEDAKALMAELKGQGLIPKALRESFRRVRDQDNADKQEHDAMVDLYVECLTRGTRGRTREKIEEFLPAPLFQGADDGQRGIPSSDADGAKMENAANASPERAAPAGHTSVESEQAVTHSHSSSPQPSRQETKAGEIIPPPVSPAIPSQSEAA